MSILKSLDIIKIGVIAKLPKTTIFKKLKQKNEINSLNNKRGFWVSITSLNVKGKLLP
jgi:hypothetical protein